MLPSPSMVDTLLGAIGIMQEAIAQRRFAIEPPDVLLTPRLGFIGRFEYYVPRWRSPKDIGQDQRKQSTQIAARSDEYSGQTV